MLSFGNRLLNPATAVVQAALLLCALCGLSYVSAQPVQRTVLAGSGFGHFPCQCGLVRERACTSDTTALYNVTYNLDWNTPRPNGAEPGWLKTFLLSHSACSVLWRTAYSVANGIRTWLRLGQEKNLKEDLSNLQYVSRSEFGPFNTGTAATSIIIQVDRNHPVVSSITPMNPSPDWFVGLDSANLCRGDSWVESATFLLHPWDAGVNNARTFTRKGNYGFSPVAPISEDSTLLTSSLLGFNGTFGSVTFTLVRIENGTRQGAAPCPLCPGGCAQRHEQFRCPVNQKWSATAPQCSVTCNSTHDECPTAPGCVCMAGFVRIEDSPNAPCVREESCKSNANPSLGETCGITNDRRPECNGRPRTENWFEVCGRSYSNPAGQCSLPCDMVRCRCMPGYRRNFEGSCELDRRSRSSPSDNETVATCSAEKNEAAGSALNPCEYDCVEMEFGEGKCPLSPITQCLCLPSYFRHTDGKCYPVSECRRLVREQTQPPVVTEAPTTQEQLVRPELCTADLGCAHYNDFGSGSGVEKCCPTCNVTRSTCANFQCPPVHGCSRYATAAQPGSCCLACTKLKRRFGRGVCSGVICPRGQICTKRGGVAMCMCKGNCGNVQRPITGLDGLSYPNSCYLRRQGCMTCSKLIP
ncbi:uncharacterized protein LOC135819401 [Sycon ciliatum]|uniref:uncharacterized protein LOC135819401 n=1 Tax=Sycon ciliatum TaxID=27933 RepID=UPI0031F60F17